MATNYGNDYNTRESVMKPRKITNYGGAGNRRLMVEGFNKHSGAKQVDGHPRFGFHTMFNIDSEKPLPTAPAIVGGNVDWTSSKVTPATQYLNSVLSEGRPMNPPPALGSLLRLGEPSRNSIHTTY